MRNSAVSSSLSVLADVTHVVLRVGVGLLFIQHGLQKLFGLLGGRVVAMDSLLGLAGVLELVGGTLLVLGLLTRPVAFILAGEMVSAYVMAHHPRGGFPVQNGGELPLLFALIFLFFVGHGAGPLSLDALWRRTRPRHDAPTGAGRRRHAA
jgi:putative oxidoreductase